MGERIEQASTTLEVIVRFAQVFQGPGVGFLAAVAVADGQPDRGPDSGESVCRSGGLHHVPLAAGGRVGRASTAPNTGASAARMPI